MAFDQPNQSQQGQPEQRGTTEEWEFNNSNSNNNSNRYSQNYRPYYPVNPTQSQRDYPVNYGATSPNSYSQPTPQQPSWGQVKKIHGSLRHFLSFLFNPECTTLRIYGLFLSIRYSL